MKGAKKLPALEPMLHKPSPLFLAVVGKISALNGYIVAKAVEMPNLPNNARPTLTECKAVI